MEELHFMQKHPSEIFPNEDKIDYSEKNKCFIQSLKTMENLMDMNAFIIDNLNKQILYATQEFFPFLLKKQLKITIWNSTSWIIVFALKRFRELQK